MPVPGRPDARNGPFVFGFTRDPASRSIGCDSSAIVGYARAFVSAICCLLGLTEISAGGSLGADRLVPGVRVADRQRAGLARGHGVRVARVTGVGR